LKRILADLTLAKATAQDVVRKELG